MKIKSTNRSAISRMVTAIAVIIIIVVVAVAAVYADSLHSTSSTTPSTTSTITTPTTSPTSVVTSSSSAATSASGQPINIGSDTELTGVFSTDGNEIAAAEQLAVNQINSNGGVDGRPLNLIVLDSQSTPSQAVTDATTFVTQNNVLAVTGTISSSDALAIQGYLNEQGVPYVIPVAADPLLTPANNTWSVRLTPDLISFGASEARYIVTQNPQAKIAIVGSQLAYFEEVGAGIVWYVQNSSKGSIVYNQLFPTSQSDYTSVVAALKAAGATVIIDNLAVTGTLYSELLQAGFNSSQIWLPSDEADSSIGTGGGVYAVSLFNAAMGNSSNGVANFVNEMTPLLDKCSACAKTVSEDSYFGYVSIYIIAQAAENVLSSGGTLTHASLMKALLNTNYKDPILGITWKFGSNGAAANWDYVVQLTSVNNTNETWSDKILAFYQWTPSQLPSYQVASQPYP